MLVGKVRVFCMRLISQPLVLVITMPSPTRAVASRRYRLVALAYPLASVLLVQENVRRTHDAIVHAT